MDVLTQISQFDSIHRFVIWLISDYDSTQYRLIGVYVSGTVSGKSKQMSTTAANYTGRLKLTDLYRLLTLKLHKGKFYNNDNNTVS